MKTTTSERSREKHQAKFPRLHTLRKRRAIEEQLAQEDLRWFSDGGDDCI